MYGFLTGLANVLMVLTSLFLICLVLIQRGKGGGLAGAFGGVGGSSAFGTKAGDVFTRVTIYVAIVWFGLAICLVWASNSAPSSAFSRGLSTDSPVSKDDDADAKGTDKDKDALPPIKPAANADKGAAPTKPEVDKGPAKGAEPAKPSTAEPANPANAGLKPTTDTPAPAGKP